ncbi:MAG TPA: aminoacyl-tRNA hydrolase [Desulfonauticus sp.]|jgi:PTH1 family peptidyl-tRNA hydrolase|nr:MAG: Peptidyl-tRNA hydrolase [Desulfonauticus sp. 38_4375]MDK2920822.1 peptidyl-tRNA hydrolase, family [Desulfonauticus sp.]HCO12066.1 aminoacyl-tRNA hydrolase [Desulfonauticus sp.]
MIKLIVGLGNPGNKYTFTRHNIGFKIIDSFLEAEEVQVIKQQNILGDLFQVNFLENKYFILKPSTYMNRSGIAVQRVANFFSFSSENILVVHDELDLPLGKIKFKQGGGTAGHNGLKSVCACLGSNAFLRLRIGIGRPQKGEDIADYVLSPFYVEEQEMLARIIKTSVEAIKCCLIQGFARAQEKFNSLNLENIFV